MKKASSERSSALWLNKTMDKGVVKGESRAKSLAFINSYLLSNTIDSLRFLIDVRDGKFDQASIGDRIYATKILLDKTLPNVNKVESSHTETKRFVVMALSDSNVKLGDEFTDYKDVEEDDGDSTPVWELPDAGEDPDGDGEGSGISDAPEGD